MLHPIQSVRLVGVRRLVGPEQRHPLGTQLRASRADPLREVLAHAVWHEELRVFGPAVEALRQPDFLIAKRLTVGRVGVLLGRARRSRCGCPR